MTLYCIMSKSKYTGETLVEIWTDKDKAFEHCYLLKTLFGDHYIKVIESKE